jgi:hypothetical protein
MKSFKVMALGLLTLSAACSTQQAQAVSVPIVVAGSVITAGGLGITALASPWIIFTPLMSSKEQDKYYKKLLAAVTVTVAGACTIGYGFTR